MKIIMNLGSLVLAVVASLAVIGVFVGLIAGLIALKGLIILFAVSVLFPTAAPALTALNCLAAGLLHGFARGVFSGRRISRDVLKEIEKSFKEGFKSKGK